MRSAWLITAAVLLASAALEIAFRHLAHAEYFWQRVPGFDFVYGFAGCWLIVVASKWLGEHSLQREEDYYGDEEA